MKKYRKKNIDHLLEPSSRQDTTRFHLSSSFLPTLLKQELKKNLDGSGCTHKYINSRGSAHFIILKQGSGNLNLTSRAYGA
jgi:hypothetical protein